MSLHTEPTARVRATGVCSQCMGTGQIRTIVAVNGRKSIEVLPCPKCQRKEAAQ